MRNIIVLLKQVPDIKEIDDNAFNKETGTLIRTKLKNVLNELDRKAIGLANCLREFEGGGKIVALTMGPPMAKEVLEYAIARNVDDAVLLTDRALSGADTVATASPLASAIRKICDEIFQSNDCYIISGMQSVDGDTAQVPSQIASELQISCVPYLANVEKIENQIVFSQISDDGERKITLKNYPSLLTVANFEYESNPTFKNTRKAHEFNIRTWSLSDLKDVKYVGMQGSKTKVVSVFAPKKIERKQNQITNIDELASIIKKSIEGNNQIEEKINVHEEYKLIEDRKKFYDRSFEGLKKENQNIYTAIQFELETLGIETLSQLQGDFYDNIKNKIIEKTQISETKFNLILESYKKTNPTYSGDVFVVCEVLNKQIRECTFELLGKANHLAKSLKVKTCALLIGSDVSSLANELIYMGADKVYVVDKKELEIFDANIYSQVVCQILKKYLPQIALFSATYRGRVLAPFASYNLECGLTADCTRLEIGDNSIQNEIGILMQTRPALGGNIMATICTKNSKIQMATARPGVMKALKKDDKRQGEIVKEDVLLDMTKQSFSLFNDKENQEFSIASFSNELVVAGGRGLQNKENFKKYIEGFAKDISQKLNCNASFGASRVAVDQEFTERKYQIGQTGTTIAPKVYIACGISGAIQHIVGVVNTQTIIAINNDKNAPIFQDADYYYVGNVEDVMPKLLEKL